MACVIHDRDNVDGDETSSTAESELLPLYNCEQKETVDQVQINPE